MRTDIHLRSDSRNLIIDTKYYAEALQEHFGKRSIRSENLYQLFSYLKNAEGKGPEYLKTEGVLLYPTVHESIDAHFVIHGHLVYVRTIDLDRPWPTIRNDLLEILFSNKKPNSLEEGRTGRSLWT